MVLHILFVIYLIGIIMGEDTCWGMDNVIDLVR